MPPSSTPAAPPEPATAPQAPSALLRSAPSRKVVVTIESAAGEMIAAPRPCAARAAISWPSVAAKPAAQRGDRDEHEAGHEDAAAAEQVGHAPAEQQEAAEGEHVGVDDPGQVLLARSRAPRRSTAARRSRSRRRGRPRTGPCRAAPSAMPASVSVLRRPWSSSGFLLLPCVRCALYNRKRSSGSAYGCTIRNHEFRLQCRARHRHDEWRAEIDMNPQRQHPPPPPSPPAREVSAARRRAAQPRARSWRPRASASPSTGWSARWRTSPAPPASGSAPSTATSPPRRRCSRRWRRTASSGSPSGHARRSRRTIPGRPSASSCAARPSWGRTIACFRRRWPSGTRSVARSARRTS